MRHHADHYKQFIEVCPGGGTRRNPKRKNAGAFSSPINASAPSTSDVQRVFDTYLQRMAQGGTYGDNMEIAAFARVFEADVMIWQRDLNYIIPGPPDKSTKPLCHIAYHVCPVRPFPITTAQSALTLDMTLTSLPQTWEHYSSIRNLIGPHAGQGLPAVQLTPLSSSQEAEVHAKIADSPRAAPWQVDMISRALPSPPDHDTIVQALQDANGDHNKVLDKFFADLDDRQTSPSAQSSSVERDVDSDEQELDGPKKRQDRRVSRASKSALKTKQTPLNRPRETSLDRLLATTQQVQPPQPHLRRRSVIVVEDSDDDWSPTPLKDGDTSSGSEYSSQPDPEPLVTKIRLRLSHPTPQPPQVPEPIPAVNKVKKLVPTRVHNKLKKQAQKAAAKERRQVAAGGNHKHALDPLAQPQSVSSLHPTMTSAIRTLYI